MFVKQSYGTMRASSPTIELKAILEPIKQRQQKKLVIKYRILYVCKIIVGDDAYIVPKN